MKTEDSARNAVVDACICAFGQGTGGFRIDLEAIAHIATAAQTANQEGRMEALWRRLHLEVLERAQVMGRLSAQLAAARGDTVIRLADVEAAVATVAKTSRSPLCDEITGLSRDGREENAA